MIQLDFVDQMLDFFSDQNLLSLDSGLKIDSLIEGTACIGNGLFPQLKRKFL